MRSVPREVRFKVQRGRLVRHVRRADGRAYTHHCSLEALQEVAWFIEAHAKDGVTTNELWRALADVPATQATVALEFLKEQRLVNTELRRNYPASSCLFEEAMVAYHALTDG
jgi:hypothetical protein